MRLVSKQYYIIPHLRLGDVIFIQVPTDEIDWENTGLPYEEGNPVSWDGDQWECAEWDGIRNTFLLVHAREALDPSDLREIMSIIGEDESPQPFQMEMKL